MLEQINLTTALLIIVVFQTILLTILFLRIDHLRRRESSMDESYFIRKAKLKSNKIVHVAIEQANKLLVNAELRGINVFAKQKRGSERAAREYEQHLDALVEEMSQQLESSQQVAEGEYEQFVEKLGKRVEMNIEKSQNMLDSKAQDLLEGTQRKINAFVNDVNHRVQEQVENELEGMRNAIEQYRKKRMRMVDDNIVDIVERTMEISLSEKLSFEEQSDLVYSALEKAKKEGVFGNEK